MSRGVKESHVCVIGDVHGHLQLGLCIAALWQKELGVSFDAVLLCGDVGTFTRESQLDNATRAHAKNNPCELEFLRQWTRSPQPPWLERIFTAIEQGGLGLECPVVMVHGNHEGFEHLAQLITRGIPEEPVSLLDLPSVDAGAHIRYLPSGWRARTRSGLVCGAIGGIEKGQRTAEYHELAYIDDAAILSLLDGDRIDILITHQGPSGVQGDHGSESLQLLLEAEIADVWCHGHSRPQRKVLSAGPRRRTLVVPMGDIAFQEKDLELDSPGPDGWAVVSLGEQIRVRREFPPFWRELRWRKWQPLPDGSLLCPVLRRRR